MRGFEGWYFKHQCGDNVVSFIPGRSESGAFVQLIDQHGSRQFDIPKLEVENDIIYAGNCEFSSRGAVVDLPGIKGEIKYGPLTPLRSDIMGPFRFLPMQCRHSVISMSHTLEGTITFDGQPRVFDGGTGYIEKDSGRSFPRSYLWLQCNDFTEPCSIMVSIAHIPFAGISFTGCICAVIFRGREYRFATYLGVEIRAFTPNYLSLSQGNLTLEVNIETPENAFPLRSPVQGKMSGTIRETNNTKIRARLCNRDEMVFDLESSHAGFEYVKA